MIKQEFFIKDLDDNIIYQLNEIKDLFNIIDLEFKNLNSFILVYMKNVSNNLEELQKLFNVFAEKNKIPDFKSIRGMRNRLVHGYGDIDYDYIADAIFDDLPISVKRCEELICQVDSGDGEDVQDVF